MFALAQLLLIVECPMSLWKSITSFILVIALAGCTSTAKMTALDRSLVKKNITRLGSGGVQIDMDGNFLLNPTAAVETFHTVAEKELGGRPYRYKYAVNKKQITRQIPEVTVAPSSSYMPIFVPTPTGSSGIGGGEAAIILGSLALILIIIELAKKDSATNSVTPPVAEKRTSAEPPAVREEVISTRILQVSGTAEPISPVSLDRNRLVEVVVPDASAAIGRVKPGVARKLAEELRRGFEGMGCQVLLTDRPQKAGYTVRTTILRAQGTPVTYSNLTLEISLQDQRTGRELTRWVVQASEKPFDLNAQNERLYGAGIATGILQKPLAMQLKRYVQ